MEMVPISSNEVKTSWVKSICFQSLKKVQVSHLWLLDSDSAPQPFDAVL